MLGQFAVFLYLVQVWPARVAFQWLLQASAVLSIVHLELHRYLAQNHAPASNDLFSSLGVANNITMARGWGVSCIAGFAFLPDATIRGGTEWMSYVPGLLYLVIGCTDLVDGLWARYAGTESVLGRRLDLEMDALGVLAASMLAVWMKRLPLVYLMVGASYYLFRFGIWYRGLRGRIVLPLNDRPMARVMAGLNMGFIGVALLPIFAARVLNWAAVFFSVPLLLGFLWDWLVVSGRMTTGCVDRLESLIAKTTGAVAMLMRIVVLGCGAVVAGAHLPTLPALEVLVGVSLSVMIVLGWLGRCAALGASCWLAQAASSSDAPPVFLVALSATLVLIILGTGPWSLWKPEDGYLSRRAGTRSTP